MNREALKSEVLKFLVKIAPEADLASLPPKARLREELDLDSVDYLRFLMSLHAAWGVEIPESDYAKLGTLEGCLDYLELRIPKSASPSPP